MGQLEPHYLSKSLFFLVGGLLFSFVPARYSFLVSVITLGSCFLTQILAHKQFRKPIIEKILHLADTDNPSDAGLLIEAVLFNDSKTNVAAIAALKRLLPQVQKGTFSSFLDRQKEGLQRIVKGINISSPSGWDDQKLMRAIFDLWIRVADPPGLAMMRQLAQNGYGWQVKNVAQDCLASADQ